MAYDYLIDKRKEDAERKSLADHIRAKGGTSEKLSWGEGFEAAVDAISTGVDTSDATATAAEVFSGKTAYLSDGKRSGTFTIENELTNQAAQIAALQEAVRGKAGIGGKVLNSIIDRSITEIEAEATRIGMSAFLNCANLTRVSFPSATQIEANAFFGCANLTRVSFPAAEIISNEAFMICRSLISVDIPKATQIGLRVFDGCNALKELHLESSTFCTAIGDPIINPTCKIYVPANLIEKYKVAANWSKYASQFVAV